MTEEQRLAALADGAFNRACEAFAAGDTDAHAQFAKLHRIIAEQYSHLRMSQEAAISTKH